MTTRQKMARYLVASLMLVGGLSWLVMAGRSDSTPPDSESLSRTSRPLPVVVQLPESVDHVMRPRSFTGSIVAARSSMLSFERPGRILSILVDEGDRVEAGQVLAQIDVGQVSSSLESARAAVRQAQAVLAELEAGPRKEVIASAQSRVDSLDADVARLEKDYKRSEKLLATRSISQERFDSIQFQRDAAIAQRDAEQRRLDELLAGTRVEQLEAQRATLERLKADVKTLTLDLEDGKLVAPFAGRIASRQLDEGTVVTAGQPALQLIEEDKLEAWIGIPPGVASSLEIDRKYDGEVLNEVFPMKLRSLRPNLDPLTRTQNAVFEIDAGTKNVVPGQIVRTRVNQPVNTRGVIVPTSALVPGPRGLWNIFVVQPEGQLWRVEHREVTVIDSLGVNSLVTGTLTAEMPVIVDGVHRVVGGQIVDVVDPRSEPAE